MASSSSFQDKDVSEPSSHSVTVSTDKVDESASSSSSPTGLFSSFNLSASFISNESTSSWIDVKDEAVAQIKLATPVLMTLLLSFGQTIVAQMLVGHVSSSALAAAALATLYANALGYSIIMGASSAIDTLCSQAFGAGNYPRMGAVAQRGILIGLCLCVPVVINWTLGFPAIVKHLGQDPELIEMGTGYLRYMAIGLPANAIFEMIKKVLIAANMPGPGAFISFTGVVIGAILGYSLVYQSSYGFYGAALALSISQWIQAALAIAYCRYHRVVSHVNRIMWNATIGKLQAFTQSNEIEEKEENGSDNSTNNQHVSPTNGSSMGGLASVDMLSHNGQQFETIHVPETDVNDVVLNQTEQQPQPQESMNGNPSSEFEGDAWTAPLSQSTLTVNTSDLSSQPIPTLSAATVSANKAEHSSYVLDCMWPRPTIASLFSGWKEYLILAIPSASMLLVEWGSYEALALISGTIGKVVLASHTILATTASLSFMPCLGFGVAVSVRVGQKLGDNNPAGAQLSHRVVLALGAILGLLNGVFVVSVRHFWGEMFTDDEQVIQHVANALFILAGYSFFDFMQCVCVGSLRGSGRPSIAAVVNVVSYLVVGLPLAWALGVSAEWGLSGIWIAFTLGVFSAACLMAGVLMRQNWKLRASIVAAQAAQGQTPKAGGH